MAGSKHARPRHRLRPGLVAAVVAAVAVGTVGLTPGTGQAAPTDEGQGQPSVAEVQRQVAVLGHQLEQVTEQYNGANLRLSKATAALGRAEAHEQQLAGDLKVNQGRARTVASSTYRGGPANSGPFSQFTSMMAGGSPDDFLERLSVLDALSHRRGETIDDLQVSKTAAATASAAARRAKAAAAQVAGDLAKKKSWIEQQIPKQEALLASLTAEQRQQALGGDAAGGTSTAADQTAATTAVSVNASGNAKVAIDAAMSKLGAPYIWAAAGPDSFDCSGLTMWAWAQAGVALPHYTGSQIQTGTPVTREQLLPGDLVFFYPDVSHVGLYIGNGQMVHAPTTGDVVKIASIDQFPWAGATRVG